MTTDPKKVLTDASYERPQTTVIIMQGDSVLCLSGLGGYNDPLNEDDEWNGYLG